MIFLCLCFLCFFSFSPPAAMLSFRFRLCLPAFLCFFFFLCLWDFPVLSFLLGMLLLSSLVSPDLPKPEELSSGLSCAPYVSTNVFISALTSKPAVVLSIPLLVLLFSVDSADCEDSLLGPGVSFIFSSPLAFASLFRESLKSKYRGLQLKEIAGCAWVKNKSSDGHWRVVLSSLLKTGKKGPVGCLGPSASSFSSFPLARVLEVSFEVSISSVLSSVDCPLVASEFCSFVSILFICSAWSEVVSSFCSPILLPVSAFFSALLTL